MPHFSHDGYAIYYEVHGHGAPVVLLHGMSMSFTGSYGAFGWVEWLTSHGLQAVAMDFRGHGKSDKPHQVSAYGSAALGGDVLALLDHLGLAKASLVGYSHGSVIALHLLHTAPQRFDKGVLLATGDGLMGLPPYVLSEVTARLAAAIERDTFPADLPKHEAAYWNFATNISGDRIAAAAAVRAEYPHCSAADLVRATMPILVVSAEKDPVLGRGVRLASTLPRGRYLEIPGVDHFQLATSEYAKNEVCWFLDTRQEGQ